MDNNLFFYVIWFLCFMHLIYNYKLCVRASVRQHSVAEPATEIFYGGTGTGFFFPTFFRRTAQG
jgi:hypothetical protein